MFTSPLVPCCVNTDGQTGLRVAGVGSTVTLGLFYPAGKATRVFDLGLCPTSANPEQRASKSKNRHERCAGAVKQSVCHARAQWRQQPALTSMAAERTPATGGQLIKTVAGLHS